MHKYWNVKLGLTVGFYILLAAMPTAARAQPPIAGTNPSARPPVSPYYSLTNPNLNPVISYYNIIRPELGYNASIQQLQTQQANAASQQAQQFTASNVLPPTGHAAGFFTQSKYFLTKGAPGVGAIGH